MLLTQLVHPEVVLNRRGERFRRMAYAEGMAGIELDSSYPRLPISTPISERVILEHLYFCKRFVERRAPTFWITESFLDALKHIDHEIPMALLPDSFLAYFAFPPGTMSDGKEEVEGAYVYLGNEPQFTQAALLPGEKVFWAYTIKASPPPKVWSFGKLYTELETGKKFSELLAQLNFVGENSVSSLSFQKAPLVVEELYRVVLNATLYLHSENPSLEPMRAHGSSGLSQTQARKLKQKAGGKLNLTTIPITLIHFNDQRVRNYSMDATQVRGHFRWQRCGEHLFRVKLIWIDEHERHFELGVERTARSRA
jgi:hypothetical protein